MQHGHKGLMFAESISIHPSKTDNSCSPAVAKYLAFESSSFSKFFVATAWGIGVVDGYVQGRQCFRISRTDHPSEELKVS